MMYYVNWVLTNAQLELLAADVSVVDYRYNKEKKKKKGEFDKTPASAESIKKANAEWKERYGNDKDAGSGLSIGDIFGKGIKSEVGIKL